MHLLNGRRHLYVLTSVVAICAPAPFTTSASAATSATATPPIAIAPGCSYKTLSSGFGMFGNTQLNIGHGYNFFTITFTNNAAVAAKEIVFGVDFAKASRIVIPDVGTFAPGATTNTTFRDNGKGMVFSARPTPNDGSVICTVVSAQFADGTTYAAPIASAAAATATATP